MDDFNLKKYLAEGRLLNEGMQWYIDQIKFDIKQKYGGDVTLTQGVSKDEKGREDSKKTQPTLTLNVGNKKIEFGMGGKHENDYGFELVSDNKSYSFKQNSIKKVISKIIKLIGEKTH